jgi:hypothetical protein
MPYHKIKPKKTKRTGIESFRYTMDKKIADLEMKRAKKFTEIGWFDVHMTEGRITSIGLHWGESKRLKNLGYSRKDQIGLLNWLEKHPKHAKKWLL